MFGKKETVIYISRHKLVAGKVALGSRPSVKKMQEYEWSGSDDLGKLILKLKKTYKLKIVRLLLSDDVSYVLKMHLTGKSAEDKGLRKAVALKLEEKLPEELDDKDWDFKTVRSRNKGFDVVVFAPVGEVFKHVEKALEKSGIVIEAVEPEIIAATRHDNPMIGIAMKKDLAGEDEDVLNLGSAEVATKDGVVSIGSNNFIRRVLSKKIVVMASVTIIVASIVSGFVWSTRDKGNGSGLSSEVSSPEKIEQSGVEAETSKAPGLEDADLSRYSLSILNGAGEESEVEYVKEILEDEGFELFSLGEAASFTYINTQVRMRSSIPDEVYVVIEEVLSSDFNVERIEDDLEKEGVDIEIVVGTRRN